MSAIWELAELIGVIPRTPDPVLARRLDRWWARPRAFGCPHVRAGGIWWVVFPNPVVVCAGCVMSRFEAEDRCLYCGEKVEPREDNNVVHEAGYLVTLARAHSECQEAAR